MSLLRETRRTALGVRALHNVLSARQHGYLAEPIRELCAEILVELGDRERAIEVLADLPLSLPPGPEPPGIDVDSNLREGEAPARAAEAERVMATDATRLGVAERHARFRAVAHGARLTMDAFLSLGGLGKRDALRASAKELEDAGEPARAGEMYALAGEAREAERVGVPTRPLPSTSLLSSATSPRSIAVASASSPFGWPRSSSPGAPIPSSPPSRGTSPLAWCVGR